VYDTRDNPLLSHKGQRITFSPFISGGPLGGDTQVYALDLEGSQYFHLPKDLILLINGEISTVSQWGSGTDVPIFERLFLGGSNNLRDFRFARSVRRIRTASRLAANQWRALLSNLRFRSSRKLAEQSFTTLVSSTVAPGFRVREHCFRYRCGTPARFANRSATPRLWISNTA